MGSFKIKQHTEVFPHDWKDFGEKGQERFTISIGAIKEAVNSYPIGHMVEENELITKAKDIQLKRTIGELVGKGLVDYKWDSDKEDIVYSITEEGETTYQANKHKLND